MNLSQSGSRCSAASPITSTFLRTYRPAEAKGDTKEPSRHSAQHQLPEFAAVSVSLKDPHPFHFTTQLLGDRIAIDAHEVRDGEREGYEFEQIELDPEGEPMEVLGRLLEKINRALSRRHIEAGELGLRIADPGVVRGRIGWDDETNGEQPMLVIDGEEYTWEDLGRMCMSYEGWQFKLEIRDPSEEV